MTESPKVQWRIVRSSREDWHGAFPAHEDGGAFLHLILDGQSPVNALSRTVLEELEALTPRLAGERGVSALLLWSAKDAHFIAGADIGEIDAISSPAVGREQAARGQRIFAALGALPFPTVAVINGTCLGGGLELALALGYRLAVDGSQTRIGLPEVNLGIIPGFGGTQRLPRLIGMPAALREILAARRLPAGAAYGKGMVDVLLPREGFQSAAMKAVKALLANGGRDIARRRRRLKGRVSPLLFEKLPPGRAFVKRRVLQQVLAKTGGHYPAPLAAVRAVVDGIALPLSAGLALEAELCGELLAGVTSKNLIAIFRSSEAARHLTVSGAEGPEGDAPSAPFAGVLGAGVMGAGIAALLLEKGCEARIRDLNDEALRRGLSHIGTQLRRLASDRRMKDHERDEMFSRLTYSTRIDGFRRADVVIEAIVERLDVKKKAIAELEGILRPDALICTNTSALSISAIQEGAQHPDRVVGLHFFNPVHRMPLIEVIAGEHTAPGALSRAVKLAQLLGKFPVLVKDSPGFLVNRLLLPYLNSACLLFENGVPGSTIDAAAVAFGMPMGPLRLLDEVGIDIAAEVAATLHGAFGDRAKPGSTLRAMKERNQLGRKTDIGFYVYKNGKPRGWNSQVRATGKHDARVSAPTDIVDYLLDPMVDEAARCLAEGIIAGPGEVDLALVMGTGFPAFRGGLLRYADGVGAARIAARLRDRNARGEQISPSPLLDEIARSGGVFYGRTKTPAPDTQSVAARV